MRRARALAVAWVLAVVAIFAMPGVAGAQAATVAAAKALCNASVARRVNDLTGLKALVAAAPNVTAADKATLSTNLTDAITGLQALETTFDADTTLATVRVDCRKIVTNFYVYLFLVPQSHLVVAGDRVAAAGGALREVASLIEAQITADKGKNTSSAQGYESEIGVKVAAAQSAASTAQGSVIPLTAAGYPGNKPTLVAARADMSNAQGAIQAAYADAQNAIKALKGL